ncbi:hypothetical protein PoB_006203300 [Plakobranchus ocellatus]|uniref:Uncharacterized protein n=1 Tax=Plakobranchus ocellatus TaxID=259542 RepID=A0AAV4CUJ8_9GAST|nr:hypothetical protein PoB_006203300 [Plakobranchus ocellatus]
MQVDKDRSLKENDCVVGGQKSSRTNKYGRGQSSHPLEPSRKAESGTAEAKLAQECRCPGQNDRKLDYAELKRTSQQGGR